MTDSATDPAARTRAVVVSSRPASAVERWLFLYMVGFVALLTLAPFHFAWPQAWRIWWLSDWRDAPANVLLFVPIGYFHALKPDQERRRSVLAATLLGAALSAAIEGIQLFLPARGTALTDLAGNTCGAMLGALLCQAVRTRLLGRVPGLLALEHPLMNVVYLLLPLMWLTGIEERADSPHAWLLLPLGAAGAFAIAGLWYHRLAAATTRPRIALVGGAGVWFAFGGSLALLRTPEIVLGGLGVVVACTLCGLAIEHRHRGHGGRVERRILVALWPCYLVYLVLLVGWPPRELLPFFAAFGYPEYAFDRHIAAKVGEQIAALTLFGYLCAETFGRSARSPRFVRARNLALGVLVAGALELAHGVLPHDQASVLRWLLGSAASAFGVALYGGQLHVVRMLRGQPSA